VLPEPFEDSRRLTGSNLYFPGTGAALETLPGLVFDETTLEEYQRNIHVAREALGWPEAAIVLRRHRTGVSLAFTAPPDQLYTATEVNEWAWWSALTLPFSPREKVAEGRMRAGASNPDATIRKKLPFDAETKNFIHQLRKDSTEPEHLIWSFVRDRRLHGQKFRRQKALGPYVLDFYCHELKLAIEVDGGQHNESEHLASDAKRDSYVASQGITTLRYWNHDVLDRTEWVMEDIWGQVHVRMAGDTDIGESIPSSALRAPSPGGRREEPVPYFAPGHAAIWDEHSALHTLRAAPKAEAKPTLIALIHASDAHQLPFLADDDEATIGEGEGSRSWFVDELPSPDAVPWQQLHAIPTALVTGSNGKTTTVRLLAAMTRAHGWRTAHSCTDGVYFEGQALEAGDFSGPTGARTALRQGRAQAAILETARGGMLRCGLAVAHANAAIVTNIAADHFGEYGIHDLEDLASVKLVVARAIDADGLLTLNADDPVLVRQSAVLPCPLGWFALDFDLPFLKEQRAAGRPTSGVRGGRLLLDFEGMRHDLGKVAAMPLTLQGRAVYNVANIAGAALTGRALGIAADTIAATLARFGQSQADNPGRLQHWRFGALDVFVDYAHNPDGLQGLLEAVDAHGRKGRLAIVLGHAGNREDADLQAVAATAASVHPDLVVLKDIAAYERGRGSGEIAAIMRAQLLADGVPPPAITTCLDEAGAARIPLSWARDGDLLILPIHEMEAREQVTALLDAMAANGWRAGDPLPATPPS
jgi:UDP-N-acetylmuramyl tripeptide synthase/very-short-patch-repair endonuclease